MADGFYTWQIFADEGRTVYKGFLKEEPLSWLACIVDNKGTVIWEERFGGRSKARTALVSRVPDEARWVEGPLPE